jgi:hypothetical protein
VQQAQPQKQLQRLRQRKYARSIKALALVLRMDDVKDALFEPMIGMAQIAAALQ